MSTHFNDSQVSPFQATTKDASNSLDFERWASQVRAQLLAALQKRAGNSQRK